MTFLLWFLEFLAPSCTNGNESKRWRTYARIKQNEEKNVFVERRHNSGYYNRQQWYCCCGCIMRHYLCVCDINSGTTLHQERRRRLRRHSRGLIVAINFLFYFVGMIPSNFVTFFNKDLPAVNVIVTPPDNPESIPFPDRERPRSQPITRPVNFARTQPAMFIIYIAKGQQQQLRSSCVAFLSLVRT